jgi:hypothetical protein
MLRLSSIAICLIVIASFVLFVTTQTSTASAHQQEIVNSIGPASSTPAKRSTAHIGAVHKTLDEASNALTSPFSGITAGSTSQWTVHGANLLLALVVYGFGLGYVSRLVRIGS